jgi:hypothetical protein
MNLSEMYTLCRAQVDADTTDAPDSVLIEYARNAYQDITRRRAQWPHLRVEYQLDTQATVADYPITAMENLAGSPVSDLEFVVAVYTESDGNVPVVTRDQALDYYGVNPLPGTIASVSVDTDSITLYPPPSAVQTLRVMGYRRFAAWPSGDPSASPDLPREFDMCIVWKMCADFWKSQEEPESAMLYENEYQRMVNERVQRAARFAATTLKPQYFTGPRRGRNPRASRDIIRRDLRV